MKKWLFAIIVVALCGCDKAAYNIQNLYDGRIYIIGHAGSGEASINNTYPENSWESEIRAIEYYGADGVETDLQLSVDSTLMMYHDEYLESMTSCGGCVSNFTAANLTQCSYKPVSAEGNLSTEYVTRLEDIFNRFSTRNIPPLYFLDLHGRVGCVDNDSELFNYYHSVMLAIQKLAVKYNIINQITITYDSYHWAEHAHANFPELHVFIDRASSFVTADVDSAYANGFAGVLCINDAITKDQVTYAHSKGLYVLIYSVGTGSAVADAIRKSPDYILADNIPLVQNTMSK